MQKDREKKQYSGGQPPRLFTPFFQCSFANPSRFGPDMFSPATVNHGGIGAGRSGRKARIRRVVLTALRWGTAASVVISGIGPTIVRGEDLAIINENSFYPEQPLWFKDTLYYAEMSKHWVMRWNGNALFWSGTGCGPTSVGRGQKETLIILCYSANALAKVDLPENTLCIFSRDENGLGFMTPNGSVNDSEGGLYFTSSGIFAKGAPAIRAVYYLRPGEVVWKVADKIWYANGGRTLS